MESGIQLKESKIPSTIEIRDPNSTDKEYRIPYLESRIYGEESRIQDCLGFWNPGNFCLWNSESRKYLFVDSRILGVETRNTNQGIRNLTTDGNLESSTLNAGSKGWNPESKTVLDSLSRGKVFTLIEF